MVVIQRRFVGVVFVLLTSVISLLAQDKRHIGVGMVFPEAVAEGTLLFYGNPLPMGEAGGVSDSLVFGLRNSPMLLQYAPPWFAPEMYKPDYDMLVMQAKSIKTGWIEVVVNRFTDRSAWVRHEDVRFLSWPEFLVSVTGIETIDRHSNPVRARPFDYSDGLSDQPERTMAPRSVSGDWIEVGPLEDPHSRAFGWVRWRYADSILVSWSLLL